MAGKKNEKKLHVYEHEVSKCNMYVLVQVHVHIIYM